jgi:hypothetical protein|tara:strand:- start:1361 stop:1813 length:453 start_codon:yes stop_codon:yes gene_type:complete
MKKSVFPNNEQHRLNLIAEHNSSVSKFTYFLMSASGAGLGFAITQVNPNEASWAMSMLFLAMMFWGGSFFAGIRYHLISHSISEVAEMAITTELSNRPDAKSLINQCKGLGKQLSDETLTWSKFQVISLLSGAVSMALWRLWEVFDEVSK